MNSWDEVTDVLVVGSGGGGMTAAVTAKDNGCDVLVIEKGDQYGGSTSMSGGAIWVPDNYLMEEAGLPDSVDEGVEYLKIITKDMVPEKRLLAYVEASIKMVKYLHERTHVHFAIIPGYSDYYPALKGSKKEGGRTIVPKPISAFKLGKMWQPMRPIPLQARAFERVLLDALEFREMFDSSIMGRLKAARILSKYYLNPIRFLAKLDPHLTLGNALIARLRLTMKDRDIPISMNTSAKEFVVENDRVTGIKAERNGKVISIHAKKGVIVAAGGFEHNLAMREKYQRQPISTDWTIGNPENNGDIHLMGEAIGATFKFMEESWWMSTTLVPDKENPYMVLVDRTLPGSIIVNSQGKRFTNEAGPYIDVVNDQYKSHSDEHSAVPAYLVADHRFHQKYPMAAIMPSASTKKYEQSGFVKVADTLKGLAEKCGIDPAGLASEVEKFNQYTKTGKDLDFKRGDTSIDRYYADPSVKPNPCLAPLSKPPYYAIEIYPGDLGTKGGMDADEHARVLREDGSPIEGLYATGNCAAPVMGDTYPGAGGTIGPAMTFGYIAALHAAGV